ncbi:hypothetical protein GCM10025868_04810 [Angustibacter aerolatus]|uniref:Uncharacterized protein n=1 Tax=Angustibacter aerolatus TaxID=1162965 RepID=A0ABQ6JC99_9ACTN|nr:hypothetical protein GCM10025868_04810 [Angustibacter aerolatus]
MLLVPVVLLCNWNRLMAVRELPPPGPRDPFVVTAHPAPRGGQPLHRRPLVWLLPLGVLALVAYAAVVP